MRLVPGILTLALVLLPAGVAGQGGPSGSSGSVFTVGARGGFELTNNDGMLGLQTRIPVPALSFLEIQGVGEITFRGTIGNRSIREEQLAVDLLYSRGGFALGGGPVFRNAFFGIDPTASEETRTGASAVLVLGGPPAPRGTLGTQLEYRYTRVGGLDFSSLTLGVNVAVGRLFR